MAGHSNGCRKSKAAGRNCDSRASTMAFRARPSASGMARRTGWDSPMPLCQTRRLDADQKDAFGQFAEQQRRRQQFAGIRLSADVECWLRASTSRILKQMDRAGRGAQRDRIQDHQSIAAGYCDPSNAIPWIPPARYSTAPYQLRLQRDRRPTRSTPTPSSPSNVFPIPNTRIGASRFSRHLSPPQAACRRLPCHGSRRPAWDHGTHRNPLRHVVTERLAALGRRCRP